MEIVYDGVNEGYVEALWWAKSANHEVEQSRVGKVRTMLTPLIMVNKDPQDRVLYNNVRNANPFFHLMEAIWMMAGDNGDWVVQFNKRFASYMDYGQFHGAYGHRWAQHWGFDQISKVIEMLKKTPNTRRAYVSLWDPVGDLDQDLKDLPCNVGMVFQTRLGKLNCYVFNRSNDLIWGMMGSNAVHFSMLLELVADCAGLPLGSLYQISVNPHIYEHHWQLLDNPENTGVSPRYHLHVDLMPDSYAAWVDDCRMFVQATSAAEYRHRWFNDVAVPMYELYINNDRKALDRIIAEDWRKAAELWIHTNRDSKAQT